MYGVGMPILFVIGSITLFNSYVSERIIVAYLMRQPPSLNDELSINALEILKWAPLLMLLNGYWMLSNPNIFENFWKELDNIESRIKSYHYFHFDID